MPVRRFVRGAARPGACLESRLHLFGESEREAGGGGDFVRARFADALHGAKLSQQRLLSFRADAGDRVEGRLHADLAAKAAVVGDGEAMRLVAQPLYEVQRL